MVQLNAPDYDLDIDGQPKPLIDIQLPNAKSIKEEDTAPNTTNSEQHTVLSMDTNRPQSQPSSVLDDTDHPGYQDDTHPRAEHPSDYCSQLEDIPELETDEENSEEDQFVDADLIDHHNTTEDSAYFEKVTEQEYSPYHNSTSGLEYQIPEPEYYNSDT